MRDGSQLSTACVMVRAISSRPAGVVMQQEPGVAFRGRFVRLEGRIAGAELDDDDVGPRRGGHDLQESRMVQGMLPSATAS